MTAFNIIRIPFGNLSIPFFPILTTYAILRHQLLDIEVIIKKSLVFAGLLASVFGMLMLPTFVIQEYILRHVSIGGRVVGLTISGIIIILTMRRIDNFLINVTDKYLFQKKYDYKELLKTFTSEVLTVLSLDTLLNLTVSKLADTVKMSSCAVLLFDSEKQRFDVAASRNLKDGPVSLAKPHDLTVFLEDTQGYFLKKEFSERGIFIPPQVREIIDGLNAELVIPMILHEKMIGILSLGKKKSDEDYTQDDLDILLPLARTLAIAISNAELFDELGKTQAEAAQKEKMAVIGTLSAGINHEICNPLGIARGQCEAFLLNIKDGIYKNRDTKELMKMAEDIMSKVIKETDRATAITKKLSSFAKPAKGESEMVDVDKEVDEVLGLVGYELKLEKIEFDKQVAKGLPKILVDRKQFQEVLFNLIRNAGQAIGEKGKITVAASDVRGLVTIDIQDTGSGIPENKIKELFNPFFTTKEPGKGTGLGLFIVRQVVEKNGGKIYLKRTKVGEGTTFTIEFPAAPGSQQKEGRDSYETTDSRNR
jgi:signal transduction histidine kinase